MLPSRTLTPEDLIAIARRRFWFLLVPFAVVSAATAIVARALPDTFQSQALVAVVPQQVPESIVRSTVATGLDSRLQAIQDSVLSRPRLEKLIQEFNLYAEERRVGIMDDVVQRMKTRDLSIRRAGPASFRVSFVGREPISTMKVVEQVASAFIAESLIDRSRVADRTNAFLETELDGARQRLLEKEQKVSAYRLQHSGELPSQIDSNLRAMEGVLARVQASVQAVNMAKQTLIELERRLADAMEAPSAGPAPQVAPAPAAEGRGGGPPGAPQELTAARRQLEVLNARYSAIHPDVERMSAWVKELEAKAAAEVKASPAARGLPAGASPAEVLRANRIEELERQRKEINAQIEQGEASINQLRQDASVYLARAQAGPTREAELTELTRDHGVLQGSFTGLLAKSETNRLTASLERHEIGEQFRLLEQATVPQRPNSPNRPQITLFGMFAGLGIGVGLIALLEYRASGFETDDQVTAVLGLPVLAVVPIMQSDPERRRARLQRLLLQVGLGGAVAGCLAVLAYTFAR